ncbi:hypothetical protein SAMN05720354_1261, partial [Nitrosospira sp. Nsp1]
MNSKDKFHKVAEIEIVDTLFPSTIIFDFSASCVKRIEPSIIERLIVGK